MEHRRRQRPSTIDSPRDSSAESTAETALKPVSDGVREGEHDRARFATLLRRHRLAVGLTQRELAGRAGVSLRAISALEAGERRMPHPDTLARLANALHLAPEDHAAFEAAAHSRPAVNERPLVLLPALPPPPPHNLPLPPSPLLGREQDLAKVSALVRDRAVRLVTLTGPGGVGKTRLALEAARVLLESGEVFPDGVWLVALAALRDRALVLPTIARALGLSERGGVPIADMLREFVREKRLLVVLDNCEQVIEAAPDVAGLLEYSAGLALLVTSRAPLRLRAEQLYPVAPLAVPPPAPSVTSSITPADARSSPLTTEQLTQYAAAALFVARVRAVQPSFQLTDATSAAVAAITAQLDGLPLAIELAATWARLLSPAALLARLEHRRPLLTAGPVDLPTRQQTMRAAIAWSYDLLSVDERALLCRLAVFAGGWTLAASEAVCLAPPGAAPLGLDAVEGLGVLLDQSLIAQRVRTNGTDGEAEETPRFEMLHVVREFALEHLEASGAAEALRHAHARYVLAFAEEAEPALRGPDDIVWMQIVERELGNVRAALEWARAAGEAEIGLRLATALWRFWTEAGYLSEGRQWIETFLAQAPAEAAEAASAANPPGASIPTWLRARALSISGGIAAAMREIGPALAALEVGIALGRAADDWLAEVIGLALLGLIADLLGEPRRAEACYEEVLALGRAHDDAITMLAALGGLGGLACAERRWPEATARLSDALAVARATGRQQYAAVFLLQLGEVALWQGEAPRAVDLLAEALAVARATNWATGWQRWVAIDTLDLLGVACAQRSQPERGARLLGAAAHLRETLRLPYEAAEQPRRETLVAPVRATLSAKRYAAAFTAGSALTLDEAIAEALAALEPPSDVAPPPAPTSTTRAGAEGLTGRECEVLRLLAEGLSDAAIAARLVISIRTVNHHTAAIYGKLGVSSRVAAAQYALEHGLI